MKFNHSFNSIFDFHPFKYPIEEDYYQLVELSKSNSHELMVHIYEISDELKDYYGDHFGRKLKFFKKANSEKNIFQN